MLVENLEGSVESKVVSITLLTPFQIKNKLILEAANGWELCSVGTNFAFLQRQRGAPLGDIAYYVESITLSLPHQIRDCLITFGTDGWALGGIGASFAFFKRARNLPSLPRDFEMESITIRGIQSISSLVEQRASHGWALCGMGRNFAFFEKIRGPDGRTITWDHKTVAHQSISITLRTPHQILELLDREGLEGWRLAAIGASYMFLRRVRADQAQPA